jgi:hypothetical protein
MIRALLIGVCVAAGITVVTWFVIPASTYVEDALGILMATFIATAAIVVVVQRLFWRKKI